MYPEQNGTLAGLSGRKPVHVPDNAKHIFVCGTTGSGKTVALSNFIQNAIENDFPALIIDGKGDTGKGKTCCNRFGGSFFSFSWIQFS